MVQQSSTAGFDGKNRVDRQPRALHAPLQGADHGRRCAEPSTAAASATSSSGEDVSIPKQDITEPVFHHGQGGVREMVHPGQPRVRRPATASHRPQGGGGGGGSGKGQASDDGEGEDDFVFSLSEEEFMRRLLRGPGPAAPDPHPARPRSPEWKSQRAGFTNDGTPTNINVVRSMRGALGRRIALGAPDQRASCTS